MTQENYFFRLTKYRQQLEELLANEDFVQPDSRRNEVRLHPLAHRPPIVGAQSLL